MNDQQRAAMQMALKALEMAEINTDFVSDKERYEEAIAAINEALAQPQDMKECRHCGWLCKPNDAPSKKGYVLAQPQGEDDLTIAYMVGYEKGKDYMKEKAALLREQLALQGVQSSWYEDGFWDGLVAYEQAIKEMK